MALVNSSSLTEFILVGLSERSELQLPLFLLFLGIYVSTVVGNLGLITLIAMNSSLHTPMFLPGESQGRESLVGYRLWGHTESDTTEVT